MFKKLNNKGMTLVEVVVCFALVTIVLVSMYNTVSIYKSKQNTESYKEKVTTYKNLLTKEIQDDLIKTGLISANVNISEEDEKYAVTMNFKDGTSKVLEIIRVKAEDAFESGYTNSFIYLGDMNRNGLFESVDIYGQDLNGDGDYTDENDTVGIKICMNYPAQCDENDKGIADVNRDGVITAEDYGTAFQDQLDLLDDGFIPYTYEIKALGTDNVSDFFSIKYGEIEYPFPDLGSSTNDYGGTVYDLRINNVEISTENNILSIYIGFYHPELLSRYAIDIVCPINYS